MQFKPGDEVVHPNYGVGRIVRLEERELAASGLRWYYVLAIDTAIIWMPVPADGSNTLRAVTNPQDLEQYRITLSGQPTLLNRDYRKRHLDLSERLTQSSFQVTCEIVRDLSALGWNKPMGETDSTLLKKIQGNLRREWAASTGQSPQEAIQEVEALLKAGRVAYQNWPPQQQSQTAPQPVS
jgi:RNA polymerase-interacting CarD/CdnL/TRCF family regulator